MRAKRVDANQADLVEAARAMGLVVVIIREPVDLLVGHRGEWVPVEVKVPRGTYTWQQRDFRADCKYLGLPVLTWRSEADVIDFVNRPYA